MLKIIDEKVSFRKFGRSKFRFVTGDRLVSRAPILMTQRLEVNNLGFPNLTESFSREHFEYSIYWRLGLGYWV